MKYKLIKMWRYKSIILAPGRLRQENCCKFESSLGLRSSCHSSQDPVSTNTTHTCTRIHVCTLNERKGRAIEYFPWEIHVGFCRH